MPGPGTPRLRVRRSAAVCTAEGALTVASAAGEVSSLRLLPEKGLDFSRGADGPVRAEPLVRFSEAPRAEADEGVGCDPGGPPHIRSCSANLRDRRCVRLLSRSDEVA